MASARIIDGRELAARWLEDLAVQVGALHAPLTLAAVCSEDDAAARAFVKLKEKAAQKAGIQFSSYFFDPRDRAGAEDILKFLGADDSVDGVFVELPLPLGWDTDAFLAGIPAEKDVDALRNGARVPAPAVRALQYILDEEHFGVSGLRVAVVGYGRLIGKPVAGWLHSQDADVTVIDVETPHPESVASAADLLVTGVGKPGLVTDAWVKEGATVIDFGYAGGKGDVADDVRQKAGALTPVPGGMGPLVIAAVMENLLTLALNRS